MLSNAKITLLVSGSIAAYKSPALVRELLHEGALVRVAMSEAASEFVSELSLQTVSGQSVYTDMFDLHSEQEIGHISLADSADVVLCAPATADVIAKAAHGIADDLITTVLLAKKGPKVFIPAMNVNMWENPITQRNVEILRDMGCVVVEPDTGELACGWRGKGRMPEADVVIDATKYALSPKLLQGTRVIVTAGPTHEPVDPVRFMSNRSSGKMGYALARVCHWYGADVTLISGPTNLCPPAGVTVVQVSTAEEMREEVIMASKKPASTDCKLQMIFMAAAVSDHRPETVHSEKLKMDKSAPYDITFEPAEDILKELGATRETIESTSGARLTLVGFAAETGDIDSLLSSARDKRDNKKVDMVVANFAEESFGNDQSRVWLVTKHGKEVEVGIADKHRIAEQIVSSAIKL